MANALADIFPRRVRVNAMAADAPMGSGMAQGAADTMKWRKAWEQEFASGATDLQFPAWLEAQGIKIPTMPR